MASNAWYLCCPTDHKSASAKPYLSWRGWRGGEGRKPSWCGIVFRVTRKGLPPSYCVTDITFSHRISVIREYKKNKSVKSDQVWDLQKKLKLISPTRARQAIGSALNYWCIGLCHTNRMRVCNMENPMSQRGKSHLVSTPFLRIL